MSTNVTENLGLTLWDGSERMSYREMNKDNEKLDAALGPVVKGFEVAATAARINAYNNMKALRYIERPGQDTAEKSGMVFGWFDSTAAEASDGALLMSEAGGYVFSPYMTSYAHGEAGDVSNTLGEEGCSFNFVAPATGYITSLEIDAKTASSGNCYLAECYFGSTYKHNVKIALTTTRAVRTLDLSSAPIAIHKGDVLKGYLKKGTSDSTGYVYSSTLGVPYIKFNITPAPETGWLKTDVEDLGSMGHSEAWAYIQVYKEDGTEVLASLVDEDGEETGMTQQGEKQTVTPDGGSCTEISFTAPYDKATAALKVSVEASKGFVDLYNGAVFVI